MFDLEPFESVYPTGSGESGLAPVMQVQPNCGVKDKSSDLLKVSGGSKKCMQKE